ncbi:hypothetical protein JRQ81_019237, partial [Phrynocephalus forsythii]
TGISRVAKRNTEEVHHEIDTTYRVSTFFTNKNKYPPEVHDKFVKSTRDKILRDTRETQIEIKNQKIRIVKDIPWKIRQIRKEYNFIVKVPIANQIQHRWMYPEGLDFTWEGRHYRLDSLNKASKFLERNNQKLGYQELDQREIMEEEEEEEAQDVEEIEIRKERKNILVF